jgi:mercuric ion transport protein
MVSNVKEALTDRAREVGFWKRHLDKIGVGGSLFAALCCLGFPGLVSILSAIGLGFLINDDILRPFLIVFLVVAILGLALGMRITEIHGH